MAQDFANNFYRSKTWQRCRESYIKYRLGLCERCLAKGIYSSGVIVHHKTHLTADNINNPEITTGFGNLMLLCRDCHAVVHKPEKRFKVDELGRVITIE